MSIDTSIETKIALVLREDLLMWQKLNVTAFLTSGLIGADADLIGKDYQDGDGNIYNALAVQPMIVLSADAEKLRQIYERAMGRGAQLSIYTEDMFKTGNDDANRATVANVKSVDLNLVGLALREPRRIVDKITKGAKMHA